VKLVPIAEAGLDVLLELDDTDDASDSERVVTGDAEGRFAFPTVPAGRYTIIAQRDGFVRQAYGQRGANQFGAVLVVAPGRNLEDLTLQMRPAPAISGIISNTVREPLAAAIVQAYRLRYTPFGRELRLIQTATTNDRGEYRLFWLSPGDYYVAVTYSRKSALRLPEELFENPNLSKPEDVSSGIFFPGQTNWAEAQAVRVEASDVSGVNIVWSDSGRVFVRGQIAGGAEGSATNAKVTLLLPDGNPVPGFNEPHRADGSGKFSLRVTPGDYVLLVESDDGRSFSEVTPLRVPARGVEDLSVPLKVGLQMGSAVLGAEKLEGVSLKLCRFGQPSLGRKACYGNYSYALHGQPEFKPFFLPYDDFEVFLYLPSGFVLTAVPVCRPIEVGPVLIQTPITLPPPCGVQIEQDKAIVLKALVSVAKKGITKDDLTALATGLLPEPKEYGTCKTGPPPNVCLAFAIARGGSSVIGSVRNRIGESVSGAQVVLVPEPVRSGEPRPPNRFFVVSTDTAGRYEIPGVPAGAYTAFAFEEIEPGAYYAPDFVQRYSFRALPVTTGGPAPPPTQGATQPSGTNLIVISREEANR
jgi:hypothetical protein